MRDAGHRTPDAGRRTSDGEKSKNNISTPQGGGHNNGISLVKNHPYYGNSFVFLFFLILILIVLL